MLGIARVASATKNTRPAGYSDAELMRIDKLSLPTNYDINSIMHYPYESHHFGIESTNNFYNEVGFAQSHVLTATDKLRLNILYECPSIKRRIVRDFLREESERTYVEMMQLQINPDEKSQR